jgi:F-type H+-transporting ATPase subunit a
METINPMRQFELKKLMKINFFGYDFSFTNASFSMIMILFISLGIVYLLKKNQKLIPSRSQSLVELILINIKSIIDDNLDKDGRKYFPFIFSLFLFILISNLLSLLPFSFSSTSHISVTFALAFIVFLITFFITIAKHGIMFFKIFVPKGTPAWLAPLLFFLELFSFFIRPVSLSVRLAANMIAGHVMLDVFAFFVIALKWAGIFPFFVLNVMMLFEFFVSLLQSYIFAVFACVYINEALHH